MNTQNQQYHAQLLATYDACLRSLPVALRDQVAKHQADPGMPDRQDVKILRIRILPTRRGLPRGFWSTSWCFYEAGAGAHHRLPEDGLFNWQVQFLHTPGNAGCSHGAYRQAVEAILRDAASKRPAEFKFNLLRTRGEYLQLARKYYAAEQPYYDPEQGGKDLAWLIAETLPRFQGLPSAPAQQK